MAGDLFHRGHLEFIKQAKKLGDFLIIGLHPDDIAKKIDKEVLLKILTSMQMEKIYI